MIGFKIVVASLLGCIGVASAAPQGQAQNSLAAVCELIPSTGSQVTGKIELVQAPGQAVTVSGVVQGLSPGLHGFHLHRDGNTGNDCKAAGPHFNPQNVPHGSPTDPTQHAGDFGNIASDDHGFAPVGFHTAQISLAPDAANGAVGRAFVVHASPDDLGKAGTEESTKTGTAGARVACCVVHPVNYSSRK